ncbi:hypothetical protein [Natrinema sp. 1APR25-10V2]|uniref:SPW repeat domain-containing protein n=1 Tax=Natrinema sp. 1APR25-10V2 TaxID=2951081 RepID=UPI00287474ED|nr:hypothetical protein [Natrinema sp. 1APR25-10V2]MDS0478115.1 hypothetical protein [Natrinema sp. 1APR25-10V2]
MEGKRRIRTKISGQWSEKFLAAVGTWVMAAPSLLGSSLELLRIDVVIGAGLVIVAGFNYGRLLAKEPTHGGAVGLSLVLGLSLTVYPFYYEVSRQMFWNDIISGILIVYISLHNIHSVIRTSAST